MEAQYDSTATVSIDRRRAMFVRVCGYFFYVRVRAQLDIQGSTPGARAAPWAVLWGAPANAPCQGLS